MTARRPRPRPSPVRPIDARVIAAIRDGDIGTLGLLFATFAGDVRRRLLRLGIRASDVDDLVHETFLEIPAAAARFTPGAEVKPWLLGVATMMALRHRRSLHRTFARLRQFAVEPTSAEIPTPAEELAMREAAQRARAALDALSAKKRDVFVSVYFEGRSCDEVAVALNIPVETVWTRLHYARTHMRTALERGR